MHRVALLTSFAVDEALQQHRLAFAPPLWAGLQRLQQAVVQYVPSVSVLGKSVQRQTRQRPQTAECFRQHTRGPRPSPVRPNHRPALSRVRDQTHLFTKIVCDDSDIRVELRHDMIGRSRPCLSTFYGLLLLPVMLQEFGTVCFRRFSFKRVSCICSHASQRAGQ